MTTLTPDSITHLLDACDDVNERLVIRTLLSTGLRASELCGLTVSSAIGPHGPRDNLVLTAHKNSAKHSGPQHVPLPESLGIAIALYANGKSPDAPLFVNKWGDRLTRYTLWSTFRRICNRAGVDSHRVHDCRHRYATAMIDAGVSIQTVSACMRHASTAVTARYLHSTPSAMRDAAQAVEV